MMPWLRPASLAFGFLLLLSPAQALDMGGSESSGPVEVVADNGIEWIQSENRFIARGNAVATRGDVAVRADVLSANYRDRPDGGGAEIAYLIAEGDVQITSTDGRAVVGDRARYDVDNGQIVITGQALRLVTPNETLTAQDSLEYHMREGVAYARGGARLIQDGRSLSADTLTAYIESGVDGAPSQGLSRLLADGNVTITTPEETARGSQGNYDAKTGIAILTGSVRIIRGTNVLDGSQATVNMRTGISTLTGQGEDGRARAVLSVGDAPARGAPQTQQPESPAQ